MSALALAAGVVPYGSLGAASAAAGDPALLGRFGIPFEEVGPFCVTDEEDPLGPRTVCKPAAASIVMLPNGKVLYWDALEGMEDVQVNVVGEFGGKAQNNQTRVLDLNGGEPRWATPSPFDGGANPGGNDGSEALLGGALQNDDDNRNDGDLFCSDQVFLADGRVLVAGGTSYYLEPGLSGLEFGVTELEGLKNTRVFDPATNTWSQTGSMNFGRWYPSLVTLPDGKVLAASGVTKLIKPVYPDRPTDSGTNVKQTETFDPDTGEWTVNRPGSERSLPLYPRLHLLPNGKVYYDAAGQTFNPAGQSYDEALWNLAAVYDPEQQSWEDIGVPQIGGLPLGFRGSGFSMMMPLQAPYDRAEFLSAGGVIGVSPGTYLGTDTSTVNTVDMSSGDEVFSSRSVGRMSQPRWYSTGVLLPNGQVMAFSGADRDEVVLPGSGTPTTTAELYDPETETWTPMASARKGRTYHNNAVLLPDGRVLVGGHAPIGTGYAFNTNALRDTLGLSSPERDPSFEIYEPPYLFWGDRPEIVAAPDTVGYGGAFAVEVDDASDISSVVVMRNEAKTHLVDSDQRAVELPVLAREGSTLLVQAPPDAAVAPPGPYTMFVNQEVEGKGTQPSEGQQLFVGAPAPDFPSTTSDRGAAPEGEESVPPPSAQRIPFAPGLPMLDSAGISTDELVNPAAGMLPTEQIETFLPKSSPPARDEQPGDRPPGETPPGETPPGETPPGGQPPGERPPGATPPAERPPGNGNSPPAGPPAVPPAGPLGTGNGNGTGTGPPATSPGNGPPAGGPGSGSAPPAGDPGGGRSGGDAPGQGPLALVPEGSLIDRVSTGKPVGSSGPVGLVAASLLAGLVAAHAALRRRTRSH